MFNIFKEFSIFWTNLTRSPYSSEYLLQQSKIAQRNSKNNKLQEILKELRLGVSDSSKGGETHFKADTFDSDNLSDYYNNCTDDEWKHLEATLVNYFKDVKIEFDNDYPYIITFDWSKHE